MTIQMSNMPLDLSQSISQAQRLTSVPPDRVAVARKLQLGVTPIPTAGGGFNLDLSTPDAHKTAAVFVPLTLWPSFCRPHLERRIRYLSPLGL